MSYSLRRNYCHRSNIENFLAREGVGEGNTFLLTLTFSEDVIDKVLAGKYWNKFLTLLRSRRYRKKIVGNDEDLLNSSFEFIACWERQEKRGKRYGNKGSWHIHIVGKCTGWSNQKFRNLITHIQSVSSAPFGHFQLIWTKGTPESVAKYLSKYITKFREPGVRLVSYSKSVVRMVKGRFSFIGGRAGEWRKLCSGIYKEFPSFKTFYHISDFDDRLRAVESFYNNKIGVFYSILRRYVNTFVLEIEYDLFKEKSLFDCV